VAEASLAPICGLGHCAVEKRRNGHEEGDDAAAIGHPDCASGRLARQDALEVSLPGNTTEEKKKPLKILD